MHFFKDRKHSKLNEFLFLKFFFRQLSGSMNFRRSSQLSPSSRYPDVLGALKFTLPRTVLHLGNGKPNEEKGIHLNLLPDFSDLVDILSFLFL
jgi:hypothetical protein